MITVRADWCNDPNWYIQFVFVAVEQRGQGAVRALVDEVRAEAGRDGAPELRLYVHPSNGRAIRAYEKLGFRPLPYMMMTLR